MATAIGKVQLSPRMLAEAFWDMDAEQQAMFFAELNDIIGDTAYSNGEAQWCAMGMELEKMPKAKEQACAMMYWIYLHTSEFLSRGV
jgi:hypothetical protein